MPAAILPLPLSMNARQLPDPARRLDSKFIQANGRPTVLWTPSKLAIAAADFSGNRNFGTLGSAVATTGDRIGLFSQSWSFNDTASSTIESSGSFPASSPMTLCVLFKPTSFSTPPIWAGYGKDLFGAGWYAEIFTNTNGTVAFSVVVTTPSTAQIRVTSAAAISLNQWYLATGVWSPASSLKIYVNDVLGNTTTTTSSVLRTSTKGFILSRSDVPANGNVALGASWQSAFSAAQVSALYSSLLTGEPYRLFAPSAIESFIGSIPATGGLLLARRRAAA